MLHPQRAAGRRRASSRPQLRRLQLRERRRCASCGHSITTQYTRQSRRACRRIIWYMIYACHKDVTPPHLHVYQNAQPLGILNEDSKLIAEIISRSAELGIDLPGSSSAIHRDLELKPPLPRKSSYDAVSPSAPTPPVAAQTAKESSPIASAPLTEDQCKTILGPVCRFSFLQLQQFSSFCFIESLVLAAVRLQGGYYPPDKARLPPMLYTFPGSGNTWSRCAAPQ